MTSQLIGVHQHPVAAFAERLNHRLDEVGQMGLTTMSPSEKREALVALAVGRAKADALYLRLLAEADASQVCLGQGAADAGGFIAKTTQQTRRDTRSDLNLARRLEGLTVLSAAMTAGGVNTAQARVIVHALDSLPSTGEFAVSVEQRAQAEAHLVGEAATCDAVTLAVLGRRIFEVIAPDAAEAYEGKRLAAEEAKAARKITFSMSEDAQGVAHGRFRIPGRHAAMLRKAIRSLTNPVRHDTSCDRGKGSGIDPDLPQAVRAGVALTQIIEAIDAHWLPTSGGVGATVVVTMTLDQLLARLDAVGVCTLDTGGQISASEARRLACRAGIIPVVLGGKSVVLDAGTKCRFHTEPMRVAMGIRDGDCTAEDCDVPAGMCHAHHDIPFSNGGATSIANGRLLYGHHHRRVHDPNYDHEKLPNSKIRFHRRT
jgi:hypothetical protein